MKMTDKVLLRQAGLVLAESSVRYKMRPLVVAVLWGGGDDGEARNSIMASTVLNLLTSSCQ